mgnify:CR=1 FL=1
MSEIRTKLYTEVSQFVDIGDEDYFQEKMSNPESRKKFYDQVSPFVDLGDYEYFEGRMSLEPEVAEPDTAVNQILKNNIVEKIEPTKDETKALGDSLLSKSNEVIYNAMPDVMDYYKQQFGEPDFADDFEGLPASQVSTTPQPEGFQSTVTDKPMYPTVENTITETMDQSVANFNKMFNSSLDRMIAGETDKSLKIIADYFNTLKDDNEEEISAQDILANFGRGLFSMAPGLLDMAMRIPEEPFKIAKAVSPSIDKTFIDDPMSSFKTDEFEDTVTKELLEMVVVHTPKMLMDIWVGSGLNPVITGLATAGDPKAQQMIADAKNNVANYPFEHLMSGVMLKQTLKAPQALKSGIAKTRAYVNEFIGKSDWYRTLTIREQGLVKAMFQEIDPATLKTLLEKVKEGDKGAEAQLVRMSSEYRTYWQERNRSGNPTVDYGGGFENWRKTRTVVDETKPVVDKTKPKKQQQIK